MKVKKQILAFEEENKTAVVLRCSNNISNLTSTEFWELCGDLYKKGGWCNNINIKVKGIHPALKSKIRVRPDPFDEIEFVSNLEEDL